MENFGITDQFLGNKLVVSVTSFCEKHMYIYMICQMGLISPTRGFEKMRLYFVYVKYITYYIQYITCVYIYMPQINWLLAENYCSYVTRLGRPCLTSQFTKIFTVNLYASKPIL